MPIWERDHFPSPPKKNMATPPGTHTHFDRSGERRSSLWGPESLLFHAFVFLTLASFAQAEAEWKQRMGGVYWSQGCIGNCLKLFFYFYFFLGVKWWIMERDVLLVLLLFPFLTGWWWSRTQIWNMIYMFKMNCTWERCLRRGLLVPCGV